MVTHRLGPAKSACPTARKLAPERGLKAATLLRWVVKPKKTKEKAEAEIQPQFRSGGQLLQDNRNKTEHL